MKRILVADDVKHVAEAIQDMLSSSFDVDVTNTGLEVLRLCRDNAYDGLIIDVQFQGGADGVEVVARLRKLNQHIRIIVFSAHDLSEEKKKYIEHELDARFFLKPLNPDEVLLYMEVDPGGSIS